MKKLGTPVHQLQISKYFIELKNKLKEEKGGSQITLLSVGIIFLIFSFLYLFMISSQIYSLIRYNREMIQEATISIIQKNYANIYHSSRESYTVGYIPNKDNGWNEQVLINREEIYDNLKNNVGLTIIDNNTLSKLDSNKNKLYTIKDIYVNISNEQLQSNTQRFIANVKYKFIFPINFLGYKNTIELNMGVKAKYTGKF